MYFSRVAGFIFLLSALALSRILSAAFARADSSNPALRERWFYYPVNLMVDDNIPKLEAVFRRAAQADYNGVLLSDYKFSKLGEMPANYFRNVDRVKKIATECHLQIVPTVFPMGYSSGLLGHDPNLADGLPVQEQLFVVDGDNVAKIQADPPVSLPENFARWNWKDDNMISTVPGEMQVINPNGKNCRVVQKLKLHVFREYHISVEVKTENFAGAPEVKVIAANGDDLNYANLGAKPSQSWTKHDVVFNTLDHEEVNIYLGAWGAQAGTLAWRNAKIEECGFVNLIRRASAPLSVQRENGPALVEGKDFDPVADVRMGCVPWPGSFDVYHQPPVIHLKTSLPAGTRLRVSYCHAITVYDGQVMICLSEPKTIDLMRDEARRMTQLWHAKGYMMSYDEIRMLNWDPADQKRHLDAGELLADNVRTGIKILRDANPGGDIYTWSDMFDPNHNAVDHYYLVRGNLASWKGLDKDVKIVLWNLEKRDASMNFFTGLGNKMLIAGYYDAAPNQCVPWLQTAKNYPNVVGLMYTTWQNKYGDLADFMATAEKQ